MSIFEGKKQNWVIVIHEWWMQHKQWTHEFITDETRKAAEAYAAKAQLDRERKFNHCTAVAIPLPDLIVVQHLKAK